MEQKRKFCNFFKILHIVIKFVEKTREIRKKRRKKEVKTLIRGKTKAIDLEKKKDFVIF